MINGYSEEMVDLGAENAPPKQHLFEPDEIETSMLGKLAIVTTIMIFASFVGVKLLFDYTLANSLESSGYNYSQKAVAPSYRTVK